jgi:hypothetical protein
MPHRRGPAPAADPPTDPGDEIVVWTVGPDGRPIEPEPPRPTEEVLLETARTVVGHLQERSATPGFRPGGHHDRPTRLGDRGEVIQSLLIRPAATTRIVGRGDLFEPPLPRLRIDEAMVERSGSGFAWPATVRTGLFSRTRATLSIHPSPSTNLTVLELLPRRMRRWQSRSFVRAGVIAVDQLGDRLRQRSAGGS